MLRITNNHQLELTKRALKEWKKSLKAIRKKYASDKNKLALLSKGYNEHIAQFKAEIKEYEERK